MAKLLVLYRKPSDGGRFNDYYAATHIPLASKLPGLLKYEVSSGPVASGQGESSVHLVATLTFESVDALQASLASPEGAAAVGDLANFADGGADILIFDDQVVS